MEATSTVDLLGCFAVAGELGRGQPAGHVAATTAIALAVAGELGLTEIEKADTYCTGLLVHAGCTAGASELASVLLCDELALVRDVCVCDPAHELEVIRVLLKHAGQGGGAVDRVRGIARVASGAATAFQEMEAGCSEVGSRIAERLGMSPGTVEALSNICETWNGKGPRKKVADASPVVARIVNAAMVVEIFLGGAGPGRALDAVQKRAGRSLDPAIAQVLAILLSDSARVSDFEAARDWEIVKALKPAIDALPGPRELDVLTLACADFADLKKPGSAAHSRRVGELAEAITLRLGDRSDGALARRAGHVHAIGQVALPSDLLAVARPSRAQEEQLRLHATFTRRILSHSPELAAIGHTAAMHHERMDGAGYPDARVGPGFPTAARAVAAACAFDEFRIRDPDVSREEALHALRANGADAFGPEVTAALCDEVSGKKSRPRPETPGGLTEREVEVLRLAAAGKSTNDIAQELVISKHTARHHIESIYSKTGLSSRAGAALFAMELGILG